MTRKISKIPKHAAILLRKAIYFGLPVAFWDILDRVTKRSGFINQKKHNVIINWLTKHYEYFISDYRDKIKNTPISSQIPKQIWICWWDGIDIMPPVVKACYNSVLRHANDFRVTVITKDNIGDFISIPDHIQKKIKSGRITITHLSDIIRMLLLDKYGGIWFDATVLVTGAINFDNMSFFTIRRDFGGRNISRQRWTGNCIGGTPKHHLFGFMSEFFREYWKKHNEMIDYFLIDYSIEVAYNSIPEIKEIINGVRQSNKNYMVLQKSLGKELDPLFFAETIENTVFHKLDWKKKFPTTTSENKPTLYGHILREYSK